MARARDEASFDRGLLDGDEVTRRNKPLEGLVRGVPGLAGKVADFDRARQGGEDRKRVFLAFRDLRKRGARGGVVKRRREVEERPLHATDGLSHRRREDRRERHPDRTGVVGAHPTGELDEFAGEYDA